MSTSHFSDQIVDTVTPLVGSGSFGGASRDVKRVGRYGISVLVTRDSIDTDVDVIVENSDDDTAWRHVETTNLVVTAAVPSNDLNKSYQPTRRFMRTRLVNNTVNGLSATELVAVAGTN